MTPRMKELLKIAQDCFERGANPFSHEVLSENHVTSSECIDLSRVIAEAIEYCIA